MSDKSSLPPFTVMRRKDRAVNDEVWIGALLHRAPFGVLAMVWEERPFAVARNFAGRFPH